ncbi:MAG: ZIP family metal transporter [Candidatus Thorarchaeota archaeon]
MNIENILFGLGLALFAGLSTSLGALVIFFINFKGKSLAKILTASLGFSAGVMISVSIFELIPFAIEETNFFLGTLFFFIGFIIIMIVDFVVPHTYKAENTNYSNIDAEFGDVSLNQKTEVTRVGYLAALGIAIHNLPEGLASFSGAVISPTLGIITAMAIAIHNIPEGLSISVPLASSGRNKPYAFFIASLSGLMEPLGAVIAAIILLPFLDQLGTLLALLLSFVAGIMLFISIDELLPVAFKYDSTNLTSSSLLIGMIVMVITLLVLH